MKKTAYKSIHTKIENSISQGKRKVMLLRLFVITQFAKYYRATLLGSIERSISGWLKNGKVELKVTNCTLSLLKHRVINYSITFKT